MSLSSVIEDALRDLAGEEAPRFVDRWRGSFEAAALGDERYRTLAKKYL